MYNEWYISGTLIREKYYQYETVYSMIKKMEWNRYHNFFSAISNRMELNQSRNSTVLFVESTSDGKLSLYVVLVQKFNR